MVHLYPVRECRLGGLFAQPADAILQRSEYCGWVVFVVHHQLAIISLSHFDLTLVDGKLPCQKHCSLLDCAGQLW